MGSTTSRQNEPARDEAREFEVLLGNKQLLSLFFIVVVLLGVFFTMGYVLGRNSAPVETARRTETYDRQNAPSAMPESGSRNESPANEAESTAESVPAPSDPTATAAAEPNAATADPSQRRTESVALKEPDPGQTFLQVRAVARPEAEVLADVLARRGFRSVVAPGPNDTLFRVLVGPAKDIDDVGKLKAELEAAGFKPFVKRY